MLKKCVLAPIIIKIVPLTEQFEDFEQWLTKAFRLK